MDGFSILRQLGFDPDGIPNPSPVGAPAAAPVLAPQVQAAPGQVARAPVAPQMTMQPPPGQGFRGEQRGAQPGYFMRQPPAAAGPTAEQPSPPASPTPGPAPGPRLGDEVRAAPTVLARLRRGDEDMAKRVMQHLGAGMSQPVAETRDPWMAAANGFRAGMGGVQAAKAAAAQQAREDEDRQYQRGRDARADEIAERRARAYEAGQTRRAPGAATDPFLTEQRMQSALDSYASRLGIDDLRERASDGGLSDAERAEIEAELEAAEAAFATYERRLMTMAGMDDAGAAPPAPEGGDAIPEITTDDEYDALPPGALFLDPEGNVRQKP